MRQPPSGPENEWSRKGRPRLRGIHPATGRRVASCLPETPPGWGQVFLESRMLGEIFFPLDNVRAQFHLMGTHQQEGVRVAASFLPPHTAEFRGLKIVELSLRGTASLHLTGGIHSFGPVFIHPSIHSSLSPSPFYHHCSGLL